MAKLNQHLNKRIGDVAEILLQYVETNQTFQGERTLSVPAESYCSQELQERESNTLFKRLPLMLALSCEIPQCGDYKATEAAGLPILITRTKSGPVRAFLNVCAHRWAPVARQGHGNSNRFTCPFHGWTYNSEGKLVGIADAHNLEIWTRQLTDFAHCRAKSETEWCSSA